MKIFIIPDDDKFKVDQDLCLHCCKCIAICPSDAIIDDYETCKIDKDKCTGCESCLDVCPTEAISFGLL